MELKQVLVVAAIVLVAGFGFLHSFLLDGLDGLLFSLLTEEVTYYAPEYSDYRFRQVEVGMTPQEVEALLGEPLDKYPIVGSPRVGWLYSSRRTDDTYRVRAVIFEKGKVTRRINYYYVD